MRRISNDQMISIVCRFSRQPSSSCNAAGAVASFTFENSNVNFRRLDFRVSYRRATSKSRIHRPWKTSTTQSRLWVDDRNCGKTSTPFLLHGLYPAMAAMESGGKVLPRRVLSPLSRNALRPRWPQWPSRLEPVLASRATRAPAAPAKAKQIADSNASQT